MDKPRKKSASKNNPNAAIAYPIGKALYLNITNRCTNHCTFCIRYKNRTFNQKHELWLSHEPTAPEIISAISDLSRWKEIVFCGYGEPLIRLETVIEVSQWVKKQNPSKKVRVDTNGTANIFHGRNILPELKGLVDEMSISLNAPDQKTYDKICNPAFGERSYEAVKEFILEAKKYIPTVVATTVGLKGIDQNACAKIAKDLKVKFRIRPYYEEKYKK
jgi:TatD DNase family protein